MKHPRSHARSQSHDILGKHEEQDKFNLNYVLPESVETMSMNTPSRQTPQFDLKSDASRTSTQDAGKKFGNSGRISLMG